MRAFLRFFFHLLYHPFAFSYDRVAATVSLGRWKDWVLSVIPFVEGTRILEIGHGPGHLQRALLSRNLLPIGMDESAPMGRMAMRNLARDLPRASTPETNQQDSAYAQPNLTRGIAQSLPFPSEAFDTIVATFPAEYISDMRTLTEVKRCLVHGGRFIILPVAMLAGRGFLDRLMSLLFRVTHQSPTDPIDIFGKRFERPFFEAGFQVEIKQIEVKSSLLLIVIATKPHAASVPA